MLLLWLGLLLLGCATPLAQDAGAASAMDLIGGLALATVTATELGTTIAQAVAAPAISATDLPRFRPPENSPQGWQFCSYSCAEDVQVEVPKPGVPGVMHISVKFKPLPNVTSASLSWLLGNLQRSVRLRLGDNTTMSVPAYLLFHGVDHLFHRLSPADSPLRVGSVMTWCELPLTGCKYDPLSATAPWTCPANRTGFVRGDPPAAWSNVFHTKAAMHVTAWNASAGIEFVARAKSPFFGGADATRTVATTRHTWSDSPQGLLLRSQTWLGLMARGSNTRFDSSLVAGPANQQIAEAYLKGAANVPANNMTAAGWQAVLHFLQEYGGLPRWLPQVYASRRTE